VLGHQLGRGRHRDLALRRRHRCDVGRDAGLRARRRLGVGDAHDLHLAEVGLPAFGVDLGDDLFADAAVTVVLDDLRQHARSRRRHLEHDLVGLDFDQDLVGLDRLTGLLLPLQERRFADRLGQLRNFHFDQ
jgi:hypothetical protein